MPSSVSSPAWVSCPRCSRRSRAGQPHCEQCGEKLVPVAPGDPPVRESQHCEECGASVLVPAGERTVSCAFCGTPYVAAGEADGSRFAPEFVLPFGIPERDAQAAFKAWLGASAWFAPGDLALRSTVSALRGVYIPFWSFSMRSESTFDSRIGEHWWETVTETYTATVNGKTVTRTRTRRVQHTEWYPFSGRHHEHHSHYLVSASAGLPQAIADAIQPFPAAEVTRYAPHFLSGWLAEEYRMERDEAARISKKVFRERERSAISGFLPGDCHDDLRVSTEFHDVTEDLILLPVWIFACSYRGKTFRYVLNGATGKAHGRKPVSAARVAAAVLLAIILLAAIATLIAFLSGGG